MSVCLLPIFPPVSSFQGFFFSVFSTVGRGHKVWLSKFSPHFCSLPKHKASISGFSAPSQLVQVHLQQLDPEGTVEVEQNAPAPRSHFRFRRGFFLVGPKKIVEELVEDWMDWKCWLCSDNLTQDARMPGCQPPRMTTNRQTHFFRIRNPQLLGPSWLPRLHPGAQVSWSEIVGALGFVDLEKEELWRSWKLDAINQISGCFFVKVSSFGLGILSRNIVEIAE